MMPIVDDWVIQDVPTPAPVEPPQAAPAPVVNDWVIQDAPSAISVRELGKELIPFNYGAKAVARARSFMGEDYDKALKEERTRTERFRHQHPVTSVAAGLAGGLVPGMGILNTIGRGASLAGTLGRSAAIGAGMGGAAGYNETDDLRGTTQGAVIGTGLGLGIPAGVAAATGVGRAVAPMVTPTLARWKANTFLPGGETGAIEIGGGGRPPGLPRAGATPAPPAPPGPPSRGAMAHFEQMTANKMIEAGVSVEDIQALRAAAAKDLQLHSSGQAQNVQMLLDANPALQKFASTIMRNNEEAFNIGKAALEGRQTGVTPAAGQKVLPLSSGIPTRGYMADRIKGEKAKELYGTDYGAGLDNYVPMGQGERALDFLERGLLIKDFQHHGHARTGRQTQADILKRVDDAADVAYGKVRDLGQNKTIAPELEKALSAWRAKIADPHNAEETGPLLNTIEKYISTLFAPGGRTITNIAKFDNAKRSLDTDLQKMRAAAGYSSENYEVAILTQFKNDLVKAVDSVEATLPNGKPNKNGLGPLYAATRAEFGEGMGHAKALQAGFDSFGKPYEVGTAAFDKLSDDAQRKLFRKGWHMAVTDRVNRMKGGQDKMQILDTPDTEQLLMHITPRSGSRGDTYYNRPEQVGRIIQGEKRMVESRYEAYGNSKTRAREVDDIKFEQMSRLTQAIQAFKDGQGGATQVGIKFAEAVFDKFFGMRADAAVAGARMLFTANPAEQEKFLRAVQARMGRNRFEQFTRLMEEAQIALQPGATAAATSGTVTPTRP